MTRVGRAGARVMAVLARIGPAPRDLILAVRIARFVMRLPADLGRSDVVSFLRSVRASSRPAARDLRRAIARIVRVRDAVLSLPMFWQRNTCYVRALTLYRFVDPGDREFRMHFGIEQREGSDRLHGHAWLTLGSDVLEAPPDVIVSALREVRIDGVA